MRAFWRSGRIHTAVRQEHSARGILPGAAEGGPPCRTTSPRGRLWLPAIALAALIGVFHPAEAQIGILGGYNRDTFEGIDVADGFAIEEDPNGFHMGIFLNVNMGLVALRPAVVYHRIVDVDVRSPTDALDFDLEIVEVPLDFRLRLPVPVVRPYLLAGPVFMFPSSPDESVDSLLETGPSRIDVGAGFEWSFGFRLWPEVRYGLGITRFMQTDFPLAGSPFSAEGDARLNSLMVRVGVSF